MTRNTLNASVKAATAIFEGPPTVSRRTAMLALATVTAMALAMSFAPPVRAEPVATGFVYTADEHGNTVSRIDLGSGKVDILPVGITPHNVQFVPGRNLLLAVGLAVPDEGKVPTEMAAPMTETAKSTKVMAAPWPRAS